MMRNIFILLVLGVPSYLQLQYNIHSTFWLDLHLAEKK